MPNIDLRSDLSLGSTSAVFNRLQTQGHFRFEITSPCKVLGPKILLTERKSIGSSFHYEACRLSMNVSTGSHCGHHIPIHGQFSSRAFDRPTIMQQARCATDA